MVKLGEDVFFVGIVVIMLVFNEDVSCVFEGMCVIYWLFEEIGKLEYFDFFMFSDLN